MPWSHDSAALLATIGAMEAGLVGPADYILLGFGQAKACVEELEALTKAREALEDGVGNLREGARSRRSLTWRVL
jgi:hypothetical protein